MRNLIFAGAGGRDASCNCGLDCGRGHCCGSGGVVQAESGEAELAAHSVDADGLYALLNPVRQVLVFDIRQPLDLLAHSETIPERSG